MMLSLDRHLNTSELVCQKKKKKKWRFVTDARRENSAFGTNQLVDAMAQS